MAAYLIAFTCLLAACLVDAQQIAPGKCNATTLPDFDVTQFTGIWYTISAIPSFIEKGDTCDKSNNTLLAPNLLQLNESTTKQPGSKLVISVSNASAPNISEPGKLVQNSTFGTSASYWILDSDYVNYSVIYSCQEFSIVRVEFAWVVSRTTSINDDIAKKVEQVFARNGISMTGLKPVVQKNCVN